MHRGFNFYGAYVSLNSREKERYSKDQLIIYYKDCICELEQKNKVLETQLDVIKDLNIKYSTELTTLRDQVA